MVCQQNFSEALKCPLYGPGSADIFGPYQSFLSRVCTFRKLNLQPMPLSHLTEYITVDDIVSNEAKWHKSCYNKFGMDRLDRAKRKRKQTDMEANSSDESSAKHVCPRCQTLDKNVCIFCEDASSRLHHFSTFQSDTSLRNMPKTFKMLLCLKKLKVEIL